MKRLILFLFIIFFYSTSCYSVTWFFNNFYQGGPFSNLQSACDYSIPFMQGQCLNFSYTVAVPPYSCSMHRADGAWCGGVALNQIECDGIFVNGVCTPCPQGEVVNIYNGSCQAPCPTQTEPGSPFGGASIGSEAGTTCDGGCITHYDQWLGEDSNGFDIWQITSYKTGEMCVVGTLTEPPTAPPPGCNDPFTVRVDGTCGPPDPVCADWQTLVNHQCVDEDCTAPAVRKCGTFNNAQVCTCVGSSECAPGAVKDLYGNCIIPTPCPNGLSRDPVTNLCSPENTYDEDGCPPDTHLVGNICVADENSECVYPQFYVSGCGCVTGATVFEQCEKNKSAGDVDGDGIPNSTDNDVDGDGIPNNVDDDDDGDGIPDNYDVTPGGLGTNHAIPTDNGDRDNDGIPDSQDPDRDGDGIDNESDSTPDGDNAVIGDPNKTKPGYDEIDPTGDLDEDGIPNISDDDRDGDGVKNNEDATPDGGPDNDGDGKPDGVKTGQCNPAIEECGDPNNPGKPVKIGDALYTAKGKTFAEVWNTFILTIKNAPLVSSGSRFLSVGSISSNCPTWTIPATDYNPAVPITIQCSSEVSSGLRIAGYILLIVFAWVAFKIAILD